MRFNNLTNKRFNFLTVVFVLTLAIFNCERDDICIDPITPKFTIRFYDTEEPELFKNVSQLSIKFDEVENDSLFFSGADSIYIQLSVVKNTTQYILTINSDDSDANPDTLTLNYTAQEVFVGRSCGFKSVFNNVDYILTNDSDNWIKRLEVVTDTIDNDLNAHIKIFH